VIGQTLTDMLNWGITPPMPCEDSRDASGYLAQLAPIAAVMNLDAECARGDYSGQT
jgi:histidine ammonia-lyase